MEKKVVADGAWLLSMYPGCDIGYDFLGDMPFDQILRIRRHTSSCDKKMVQREIGFQCDGGIVEKRFIPSSKICQGNLVIPFTLENQEGDVQ
jgi:hypothetical protein